MDQKKIGAFIAQRRKEKGLTQSRLAEQFGITDKAVSKWETGKSMPDVSLFAPLCKALDITLNELLLGEQIPQEQLREKSDALLFEVITQWLGQPRGQFFSGDLGGETVLQLDHVSKHYHSHGTAIAAVQDVSFTVQKGSFVGIMGASGCGKSTLLQMIATITQPSSGSIYLAGQDMAEISHQGLAAFRRKHLGFIFQQYNLIDTLTVYENIALALTINGAAADSIAATIAKLSSQLQITDILERFPYEISGGQQQRCACARAIAVMPSLLLADEPTGALDSRSARQLLELLCLLRQQYGATILMVTHDAFSASYCDRILMMGDGKIHAALERHQQDTQGFFARILEMTAQMAKEKDYVL